MELVARPIRLFIARDYEYEDCSRECFFDKMDFLSNCFDLCIESIRIEVNDGLEVHEFLDRGCSY